MLDYSQLLSDKLDLVLITSKNVNGVLARMGKEIFNYLYIIDPYLDNPIYIEDLIKGPLLDIKEIRILFNYDRSVETGTIYEDIKANVFRYFGQLKYENKVILKSMHNLPDSIKPFHDRYVITEKRCWSVGSSFNYLGIGSNCFLSDVDNICSDKKAESYPRKSKIIFTKFEKMWDSIHKKISYEYEEFQF